MGQVMLGSRPGWHNAALNSSRGGKDADIIIPAGAVDDGLNLSR